MYELGKTIWADDHPELYGEALDFDALANVKSNELLLYDDDATEPFGGVVCTLAEYTEHGVLLDTGGEKLTAVDRDELEEEAGIWRMKTDGLPETDGKEPEMKPDENASETVPMLTEKQQAEALHKQITGYGEVIYQSLYGMCTAIKQMRDSKLYKVLGFDTFEAYTEEKLGMKRAQAYTYIAIADRLSADFVQSTGQIGIQKLYLLAMAPEETRTEITQTVDLESTTVRELKAQIAALQNQNEDAEKSRADAEKRAQQWYERASEEKQKGEEMLADCKRYWNGRAHEMEARIKDLEQRPVDVAMDETAADRIKALNEELMQKKAEAAIARVRADAKAQEAADAVRAEYEQKIAEMQAQKQETKPDSSLVFEAFMANAVKSIELLVDFLSAYRDDEKHQQFVAEFDTFMARVADEVAGV
jgi:hypothetical protein